MNLRILYCISIFSLIIFGCKTYEQPNEAKRILQLAEGGGFTGDVTTYYIANNGQIWRKSTHDENYLEYLPVKKSVAKKWIYSADELIRIEGQRNEPDNIYKSISVGNKDSSKVFLWYKTAKGTDKANELYQDVLLEIMRTNNNGLAR